MTTRTTSTTDDAGISAATPRQWMTAKVGQCVTTCAACGDVIVINPGEKKYCELHAERTVLCECGGEMQSDESGSICLACGWWPGRDTPPGELINGVLCDREGAPMLRQLDTVVDLDSAARWLGAYIRTHAVPLAGRAQA